MQYSYYFRVLIIKLLNNCIMKNFGNIKLLAIVVAMFFMVSCDNEGSNVTYMSALGEFEKVTPTEYFIDTDKDNKFRVLNALELVRAGIKEDDRILAYFYAEGQKPSDSKYNADVTVTECVTIPIKEPVLLTEDNKDKLGDDRVSVVGLWFGKEYLNFQYRFVATGSVKHELNLVDVPNPEVNKPGYKYFEIRHNAKNDHGQKYFSGIVSFDLSDFREAHPDIKGIVVGVNYGEGETKLFELPFDQKSDDEPKFKMGTLEANRITE